MRFSFEADELRGPLGDRGCVWLEVPEKVFACRLHKVTSGPPSRPAVLEMFFADYRWRSAAPNFCVGS